MKERKRAKVIKLKGFTSRPHNFETEFVVARSKILLHAMIDKLPEGVITRKQFMETVGVPAMPFTYCSFCGVEAKIEIIGNICTEYTKDPTKTCSFEEAWSKR